MLSETQMNSKHQYYKSILTVSQNIKQVIKNEQKYTKIIKEKTTIKPFFICRFIWAPLTNSLAFYKGWGKRWPQGDIR